MKILNTDIAKYKVVYKNTEGTMVTEVFSTFSAAAGCASAIKGTRFINVDFSSQDGTFSLSGSLYCYNGHTNRRRICNKYLVDQVTLREGK